MQKVIYFDEGSVTDLLQIEFGGTIQSIDEDKGTFHFGANAELAGEAGFNIKFFTAIKAAFNTKVGSDISKSRDSLISKTISNTILSDFNNLSNKLEDEKKIFKFSKFNVRPIKNSFSFIKMFTPYIKIFKEDFDFGEEMNNINIQDLDEILLNARGYYELLAYRDEVEIILRFNIKVFRNSYGLMDLLKMKLTYYAVEVGEAAEKDLSVQEEMNIEQISTRLSIDELENNPNSQNEKKLKMYDVILAGVESENIAN